MSSFFVGAFCCVLCIIIMYVDETIYVFIFCFGCWIVICFLVHTWHTISEPSTQNIQMGRQMALMVKCSVKNELLVKNSQIRAEHTRKNCSQNAQLRPQPEEMDSHMWYMWKGALKKHFLLWSIMFLLLARIINYSLVCHWSSDYKKNNPRDEWFDSGKSPSARNLILKHLSTCSY